MAIVPTTWNPSDKGSAVTLSNGNLTGTSPAANGTVRAAVGKSSGKWYWEVTLSSFPIGGYCPGVGVADASATLTNYLGFDAHGWAWFGNEVKKYNNNASVAYGTAWSLTSDVIGVALDMDAGTVTLYKNGSTFGTMYSGLTGTIYPCCSGNASTPSNFTANFGATAFAYTPPAGFTAGIGDPALAVAGVVRDAAGAVAARTVRAYNRATGALVGSTTSDAGTGAYSISTTTADEVTVIALDNATSGTIYNDTCARVIPA